MRLKLLFWLMLFVFFVSCSSDSSDPDSGYSSDSNNGGNSSNSANEGSLDDLGLENAIVIKFSRNTIDVINPHEEVTITQTDGVVEVRVDSLTQTEYNLVVSGTATDGMLKIYGDFRMTIHLNGVTIINEIKGPAINIQNGKRMAINLVGQTYNYLTDGLAYTTLVAGEDAKGAFFSEGQLVFRGSGHLEVKGRYSHAIVTDDYFTIESGNITIPSAENDGIHANDNISIKGGVVNITSKGEAIQSEKADVIISGGQITAKTTGIKSHGIESFNNISISDTSGTAKLDITSFGNGSKGIKSTGWTEILGGTVNIQISGSRYVDNNKIPPDTSNASGMKVDQDLFIEGGSLTIKSTGDKAKGISVDGSIEMKAGSINIEADDDGIKVDRNLTVTGGSGTVKSIKKKAIDCRGSCNSGNLTIKDAGSF